MQQTRNPTMEQVDTLFPEKSEQWRNGYRDGYINAIRYADGARGTVIHTSTDYTCGYTKGWKDAGGPDQGK